MKFSALNVRNNTVLKTASHTATLLKFYKKAVFFNV
jgi:hypothetical protein